MSRIGIEQAFGNLTRALAADLTVACLGQQRPHRVVVWVAAVFTTQSGSPNWTLRTETECCTMLLRRGFWGGRRIWYMHPHATVLHIWRIDTSLPFMLLMERFRHLAPLRKALHASAHESYLSVSADDGRPCAPLATIPVARFRVSRPSRSQRPSRPICLTSGPGQNQNRLRRRLDHPGCDHHPCPLVLPNALSHQLQLHAATAMTVWHSRRIRAYAAFHSDRPYIKEKQYQASLEDKPRCRAYHARHQRHQDRPEQLAVSRRIRRRLQGSGRKIPRPRLRPRVFVCRTSFVRDDGLTINEPNILVELPDH